MTLRTLSLQARQLLAASLGLVAFLGLTGLALDRAFTETAQSSLQERLRSNTLAYIGGFDPLPNGQLYPPDLPPDPRFNRPGSGMYAAAIGATVRWQSPSTLGRQLPFDQPMRLKQESFDGPIQIFDSRGDPLPAYRYALGVEWERKDRRGEIQVIPATFYVIESTAALDRQIMVFRRALWSYLGGAGMLLLGLQTLVLRWSLRPLWRVSSELNQVKRGRRGLMSEQHPRELAPLAGSINAFIQSERQNIDRYRHTLSDLAHSLKTPLAVLRARLDNGATASELREDVDTQVQRMSEIVSYQLSRAATSGHQVFAAPIEIESRAEEIVRGLEKIYADKNALCEFDLDPAARFHGELGDLQELLGNLLENAFKWAAHRVLLTVQSLPGVGNARAGLLIVVDDDGEGVAPERAERLLQRGVRGDERVQGHGIGLAIVQDIVRAYRGELEVTRSPDLGGARFTVRFPPSP